MTTKRMSAAERKIFTSKSVLAADATRPMKLLEPALGTVDQRLSIIIARLGGGNGIPRNLRGPKATPKRQEAFTKRCTPGERKAFTPDARQRATMENMPGRPQCGEPALGTVDERLSIVLARLGKPERAVSMDRSERYVYEQWLGEHGLVNGFLSVLDKRGAA